MNKVLNVTADYNDLYSSDSVFGRIRDRMNTITIGRKEIYDLNTSILFLKFPSNISKNAYYRNMDRFLRKYKDFNIAPSINRLYDYQILSLFQKKVLAYSVVRSIRLYLRTCNKSIRNACIAINDANCMCNYLIIQELSKCCSNIIFIAESNEDIRMLYKWRDLIIDKFGISPIITNEKENVFKNADFILSSSGIENPVNCPIWYLTNSWMVDNTDNTKINNVNFSTPWLDDDQFTTPELLSELIKNINRNKIETTLEEYDIFISKIKFNNKVIKF